ncbi:MAG: ABC transporter ATP-binding protein [Phycisphaerales bacterium]
MKSDSPASPGSAQPVTIRLCGIEKVYRIGVERVNALRGIDLEIRKNEFVAIMGASGSGKSTLMNILGCLDQPTAGAYVLNGRTVESLGAAALARVRNEEIGFVFQSFELLPRHTALKNVALPLLYSRRFWIGATARARKALHRVGLAKRTRHKPNQLSGGQRQRVAIARALVGEPTILLADEPTGNLDSKTSEEIIELFKQLHAEGQTIIVVTHEEDVARHAERIVRLRDGKIFSDFATTVDPIHIEYLARMAQQAVKNAEAQVEYHAAAAQAEAADRPGTPEAEGQP